MPKHEASIGCLTFQKQESEIKKITEKINQAKGLKEKVELAAELQKEVGVLLLCPDYNEKNFDCKNCRIISNLRQKTANLIIKAKRLA